MASSIKKKTEIQKAMEGKTAEAMNEARSIATPNKIERKPADSKLVSIRLDEYDHRRLKALFASEGVKLATGIKTAALWIAEMADSGVLKVTKAGIINRRD